MSLVEHAKYELGRAGLMDRDSDYDGRLGRAALEIVKVFADQGHSGMSAMATIDIVTKLMAFKPLTPITSDPDEWIDVSEQSGYPFWQNKRRSTSFSRDGGKTWYDIEDPTANNGDAERPDDAWETVELGVNVHPGDEVRVKYNAYGEGSLALRHNGQLGILVRVNAGMCAVRYTDGHEYMHVPSRLEVPKPS